MSSYTLVTDLSSFPCTNFCKGHQSRTWPLNLEKEEIRLNMLKPVHSWKIRIHLCIIVLWEIEKSLRHKRISFGMRREAGIGSYQFHWRILLVFPSSRPGPILGPRGDFDFQFHPGFGYERSKVIRWAPSPAGWIFMV